MQSIELKVTLLLARTLFLQGNKFANISENKFSRKFPNLQYFACVNLELYYLST